MLKVLTVDVTNKCNYNCLYCHSRLLPKEDIQIREIEAILEQAKKLGLSDVFLSGGEPLLYKHLLEIFDICLEKRIYVSLFTAGPDGCQKLLEKFLSYPNLSQIRVSLDSIQPELLRAIKNSPNAYKNAIRTVEMLSESKANFGISMTVSKINSHDIDEVLDYSIQKTASYFRLSTPMTKNRQENTENAIRYLFILLDILSSRLNSLRYPCYPTIEDGKKFASIFDCNCPGCSHTAYIFKSSGKIFISPCPYSSDLRVEVKGLDFEEAYRRMHEELNRKNPDKACLAAEGNGTSIMKLLFEKALDMVSSKQDNYRYQLLLSAIINRQSEIFSFGYYPCWRSSPLFLHPLRQVII